jgi:hypothetical protein
MDDAEDKLAQPSRASVQELPSFGKAQPITREDPHHTVHGAVAAFMSCYGIKP